MGTRKKNIQFTVDKPPIQRKKKVLVREKKNVPKKWIVWNGKLKKKIIDYGFLHGLHCMINFSRARDFLFFNVVL